VLALGAVLYSSVFAGGWDKDKGTDSVIIMSFGALSSQQLWTPYCLEFMPSNFQDIIYA